MNIKFKMPKFGRKLTGSSMVKELLLTTLATTISIILTFGTAYVLDQRQADKARRQTSMMLIHDIDVNVALLDRMAEGEEKQKAAIQYVIDHLDQLDSLPEDTIFTAMSMLGTLFSDQTYFDDAKEKVFNSSQDTWKNLDDVSFVDNMESFYESRHYLEALMTQSLLWKYPMSQEEFRDMAVVINSNRQSPVKTYAAVLVEKLKDPKIRYYIDYSAYRARILRQYSQSWKRLSDRNKFIMNIEDEELAEYVRKSQRSGRPVDKDELIGHWENNLSGKDIQYYDFIKPDSFSVRQLRYYDNPFYSGAIIVTVIYGGKWQLKGDSLTLSYSPASVKAEVDRSGISYRAEMRDSVESFIDRYFQVKRLVETGREQTLSKTDTLAVSTNKAGDKIEVVVGQSDNPESENAHSFYLKRTKDSSK